MTDTERETQIKAHGEAMLAAYARYEATGCFGDRGEADGARLAMQAAIAARSAAQVATMEAEITV